MKRELIQTLQIAYALALAEAKTAQTAAEGIRAVLRNAHGFSATAEPEEVQTDRPAPVKPEPKKPEAVSPAIVSAMATVALRKCKRVQKAAKVAKTPTAQIEARMCDGCGRLFPPWRKDQRFCTKKCAKTRTASKAPAVANKAPAVAPAPVSRVDRIKAAAARVDGLPQSVLDAAAEAAASEAL